MNYKKRQKEIHKRKAEIKQLTKEEKRKIKLRELYKYTIDFDIDKI
jgi:hypothetical protein